MRVPQVSERIKEAPAQALRGVFAGIGQLLLITDKLRNKTPASQQVPQARAPEPAETVSPAVPVPADPPVPAPAPAAAPASAAASAPAAAPASAAASAPAAPAPAADRGFDKTGNVRLLTSADATAGDPAIEATAAEAAPAAPAAEAAPAAPAAEAAPAAPAAEAAPAAPVPETVPGAPLPNYDELSIASLRARLRNLDVAQLRQLVEYESAHAGRADVITMFERRIAKRQAETSAEERGEAEAEA
jgi:2-oxoglutarate dehydrogenase E2 component (dihydrolipoamide succinyltransferase)